MKKLLCVLLSIMMLIPLYSCGNQAKETLSEEEQSEVNNIFISKSELELGVGASEQLIATVSPGNAHAVLQWSSSNVNVVQVDQNGNIVAKNPGTSVVKVQAENGVLAVCTVTVKIQTGKVTGVVTYYAGGSRADVGADVILISKKVKSLPDGSRIGWENVTWPEGVYYTRVAADGTYTLDNVSVGEYYIVIQSSQTFGIYDGKNTEEAIKVWGDIYNLFDDDGKMYAYITTKMYPTSVKTITVKANETVTCSYNS